MTITAAQCNWNQLQSEWTSGIQLQLERAQQEKTFTSTSLESFIVNNQLQIERVPQGNKKKQQKNTDQLQKQQISSDITTEDSTNQLQQEKSTTMGTQLQPEKAPSEPQLHTEVYIKEEPPSTEENSTEYETHTNFEAVNFKIPNIPPEYFNTTDFNYENSVDEFEERNKPKHQCSECFETFDNNKELLSHLKTHVIIFENAAKCLICHSTLKRNSVAYHLKQHLGIKNYQCVICNESFSTKHNLTNHLTTHPQETFDCAICNRVFVSKQLLEEHVKLHIPDKRKEKCSVCNIYVIRRKLKRHMDIHEGVKNFSCCMCNKAFARKDTLKTHMRVHSKYK